MRIGALDLTKKNCVAYNNLWELHVTDALDISTINACSFNIGDIKETQLLDILKMLIKKL